MATIRELIAQIKSGEAKFTELHIRPLALPGEEQLEPMIVRITPGEASDELLTELFQAIDNYYRALGGSGLKIQAGDR